MSNDQLSKDVKQLRVENEFFNRRIEEIKKYRSNLTIQNLTKTEDHLTVAEQDLAGK